LYYATFHGQANISPQSFKQKLISSAVPYAAVQGCTLKKCGAGLPNITGILSP
jgi:hypothetical protein